MKLKVLYFPAKGLRIACQVDRWKADVKINIKILVSGSLMKHAGCMKNGE